MKTQEITMYEGTTQRISLCKNNMVRIAMTDSESVYDTVFFIPISTYEEAKIRLGDFLRVGANGGRWVEYDHWWYFILGGVDRVEVYPPEETEIEVETYHDEPEPEPEPEAEGKQAPYHHWAWEAHRNALSEAEQDDSKAYSKYHELKKIKGIGSGTVDKIVHKYGSYFVFFRNVSFDGLKSINGISPKKAKDILFFIAT
jgi:hypothetical protein